MNNKYYGKEIFDDSNEESVFKTYRVKKGDSLYSISKENKIELETLIKINGLGKSSYIYPNQTLLIPNDNYKTYITKENDTLENVSKKLNVSIADILRYNSLFLMENQLIIYREYV